jgi:ribose transport system permease protein
MMYELDAIAATVIGGTSLSGGSGSLAGTLVGALIMACCATASTCLVYLHSSNRS